MASNPGIDPGLDLYWEAIDIATEHRDALFRTAIAEYEREIAEAKNAYIRYQNQRSELRETARNGSGQEGGK